jgi:periplasmic divalent cation tolerance protein
MALEDHFQLVLCTCPDQESAQLIAEQLVDAKLAACVNILPGIVSIYRWQGAIESTQEQLLLIKTTTENYDRLERTINELHPYELPEVIAIPIENGLESYLSWIDDSLDKHSVD